MTGPPPHLADSYTVVAVLVCGVAGRGQAAVVGELPAGGEVGYLAGGGDFTEVLTVLLRSTVEL